MKLKDFKNLEPGNRVILNNGRICQVERVHKSMVGHYYADLYYIDTFRQVTKRPRQIREKVKE